MYYHVLITQSGAGCSNQVTSSCARVVLNEPSPPLIDVSNHTPGAILCQGTTLNISFISGTGGSGGCADEYHYSENNGGTWTSFTPPLSRQLNTINTFKVRTRRTCSSICVDENIFDWSIIDDDFAITTQPQDISTCANTNQTLSVTVSGGVGPYTYQWYGLSNCGASNSTTVGTNSSNLTVNVANDSSFFVIITDASGSNCQTKISNCVNVTISGGGGGSTLIWEGDVSNDWFEPGNWGGGCGGGGAVPTDTSDVIIPAGIDNSYWYPEIRDNSVLDANYGTAIAGKAVCRTIKLDETYDIGLSTRKPSLTIKSPVNGGKPELRVNDR
jgi:hypothetical protein